MKLKNTNKTKLASGLLAGGMMFTGVASAANVIVDSNFDGDDTAAGPWGDYTKYAQTYGGVTGPDLNLVTTVDYGFFDNISLNAGANYMGLETNVANELTQTVSLVSADVTAAQILAGDGRFAFSGWLQTCCDDDPALTLTFNDGASTQVIHSSVTLTNQVTTADKEVNPGGADNTLSETSERYWKFYELKGVIPTDATSATILISIAPGEAGTGSFDLGSDLVILDTVAVPEPSSTALLGLGGLALILRRRK